MLFVPKNMKGSIFVPKNVEASKSCVIVEPWFVSTAFMGNL